MERGEGGDAMAAFNAQVGEIAAGSVSMKRVIRSAPIYSVSTARQVMVFLPQLFL
ncbi:hypothetical protein FHT72_006391 [Rhizobium sp. BK077]|uniref:hypothetical protein n=1 Tax=unclassified Rhizobium TaxID=2613769 RepID=UPI001616F104|nr:MULTISPECIES: hypothetical protein [unclassified Rhizobium]MBB3302966.1 hypothetical protein [Rhizobium sp. BK112]MBB3371859.1 hypothetical protein [Rhizobium sp. BK077]MBB4182826.1 hypothetical protein [Rhizobium sp. BK109]